MDEAPQHHRQFGAWRQFFTIVAGWTEEEAEAWIREQREVLGVSYEMFAGLSTRPGLIDEAVRSILPASIVEGRSQEEVWSIISACTDATLIDEEDRHYLATPPGEFDYHAARGRLLRTLESLGLPTDLAHSRAESVVSRDTRAYDSAHYHQLLDVWRTFFTVVAGWSEEEAETSTRTKRRSLSSLSDRDFLTVMNNPCPIGASGPVDHSSIGCRRPFARRSFVNHPCVYLCDPRR